jgi:hypothetical protein
MSVVLNIFSEFNSSGVEKAKKEFAQLDGAAAKSKFAFKKALIPATAAVAGLGAALFDATKGAMEDAAAQEILTKSLKNNTAATDAQIAANEDWISTQGKLLGVTDDDLRPALAKLARQTGSLEKAQQGASLAMDIAAATGKPLATVTDALAKGYAGNTTALAKLDPKLRNLVKGGLDAEGAMSVLADTFGGSATTKANTAEGQFQRLSVSLAETKETIGAALLPIIEKVLPFLTRMGDWASENTTAFLVIAGAIGGIAAAIVLVNTAMAIWTTVTTVFTGVMAAFNAVMAMNPIVLIVIGIGLLIAALVIAYKKFEGFRNVVDTVFRFVGNAVKLWVDGVKIYFGVVYTIFKTLFNSIASLWNNTIGKLSFKFPSFVPGFGGKGFDVPNIPLLAQGGIVTSPTLAMIGEGAGPEAVIPLSRMGEFGMGGGGNVTIHVNGGDPQAVVDALRTYMFRNGSVPIRVSG